MGVRRAKALTDDLATGAASTEPHSWECGELAALAPGGSTPPGFNGAALVGVRRVVPLTFDPMPRTMLQRSRTRGSAERRLPRPCHNVRPRCFNGAALVGVRRETSRKSAGTHLFSFNGAALVGVRRAGPLTPPASPPHRASTEPHSWECGERAAIGLYQPSQLCFNGAALVGVRRGPPSR